MAVINTSANYIRYIAELKTIADRKKIELTPKYVIQNDARRLFREVEADHPHIMTAECLVNDVLEIIKKRPQQAHRFSVVWSKNPNESHDHFSLILHIYNRPNRPLQGDETDYTFHYFSTYNLASGKKTLRGPKAVEEYVYQTINAVHCAAYHTVTTLTGCEKNERHTCMDTIQTFLDAIPVGFDLDAIPTYWPNFNQAVRTLRIIRHPPVTKGEMSSLRARAADTPKVKGPKPSRSVSPSKKPPPVPMSAAEREKPAKVTRKRRDNSPVFDSSTQPSASRPDTSIPADKTSPPAENLTTTGQLKFKIDHGIIKPVTTITAGKKKKKPAYQPPKRKRSNLFTFYRKPKKGLALKAKIPSFTSHIQGGTKPKQDWTKRHNGDHGEEPREESPPPPLSPPGVILTPESDRPSRIRSRPLRYSDSPPGNIRVSTFVPPSQRGNVKIPFVTRKSNVSGAPIGPIVPIVDVWALPSDEEETSPAPPPRPLRSQPGTKTRVPSPSPVRPPWTPISRRLLPVPYRDRTFLEDTEPSTRHHVDDDIHPADVHWQPQPYILRRRVFIECSEISTQVEAANVDRELHDDTPGYLVPTHPSDFETSGIRVRLPQMIANGPTPTAPPRPRRRSTPTAPPIDQS